MKHKTFKPFDKVLVRDGQDVWQIDFYSHWNKDYAQHVTLAYGDGVIFKDEDILPFEGCEHFLGVKAVIGVEFKVGEFYFFADDENSKADLWSFGQLERLQENVFETKRTNWSFAVPFSDFNPNDMEETRKHTLCVKNGKIVRAR